MIRIYSRIVVISIKSCSIVCMNIKKNPFIRIAICRKHVIVCHLLWHIWKIGLCFSTPLFVQGDNFLYGCDFGFGITKLIINCIRERRVYSFISPWRNELSHSKKKNVFMWKRATGCKVCCIIEVWGYQFCWKLLSL